MPVKKTTNAKVRALPTRKKADDQDAQHLKLWIEQLPPIIRKALKKVGKYEVCIESSGVVNCAQMKVDTYGWVTLLDVSPVNERPHITMDVAVARIIYVVEVPTLKPAFA